METVVSMKREIVYYKTKDGKIPVIEFYKSLENDKINKIAYVLEIVRFVKIVPKKFLKKLKGTSNIWEIRISIKNNQIRLFAFFEENNIIVLNHAFVKKIQKTSKKEILIAKQRKRDYYERKK